MKKIDSYSILRRLSIVSELATEHTNLYSNSHCGNLYTRARESNNENDIINLIKECSSNNRNAKIYARPLAEIVSGNNKLEGIYESTLLPKLGDFTLNDVLGSNKLSESLRTSIEEQSTFNRVCDEIYSNHTSLCATYNMDNFIRENKNIDAELVANKVCDIVNTYNAPAYGKFQVAALECYYLMDKYNLKYNSTSLLNYLSEYFLMRNGNEDGNNERLISKCLTESNLKYIYEFGESENTEIKDICSKFMSNGEITKNSIDKLRHDVMKQENEDIATDLNVYLNTLLRIHLIKDCKEESEYINHTILGKLYNDIRFDDYDDINLAYKRVNWQIEKINNYENNYDLDEDIKKRLVDYRKTLSAIADLLKQDKEEVYSSYNNECMTRNIPAQEISLNEYQVFKFDNLITRTAKLDKYIMKKIEPARDKIFKKIADTNREILSQKLFEDAIYDFVTPDGNIDYTIESFSYDLSAFRNPRELHEMLTNIIMEANESILNGTDYTCYYEIAPDCIEFHVREFANIALTEEEREKVENRISPLDEERMITIMTTAMNISENYDYLKEAVKYFSKPMDFNTKMDRFEAFLETSSIIGVSMDSIRNTYFSILEHIDDYYEKSRFRYYCSSMIESYVPKNNMDSMSILEAYDYSQYIFELVHDPYTAVNTKNLSKYGYNGEDEHLKRDDEDDDERPKKKVEKPQEYNTPSNDDPDDYQDIEKQGPSASMAATNAKLYAKGIAQKGKEFSAKEQRVSRMADAIFNRFVRSCKNALVSDRREAIIKGSVIPSFSRCVKIGIALAALGAVNPLAGIITAFGGFVMSKQLTKRERLLLLDDIETEINVIDKELQIADSNNQINKYRALMKMKKDLQRQYQRIKFNVRVGKDIIPSKTGVDAED